MGTEHPSSRITLSTYKVLQSTPSTSTNIKQLQASAKHCASCSFLMVLSLVSKFSCHVCTNQLSPNSRRYCSRLIKCSNTLMAVHALPFECLFFCPDSDFHLLSVPLSRLYHCLWHAGGIRGSALFLPFESSESRMTSMSRKPLSSLFKTRGLFSAGEQCPLHCKGKAELSHGSVSHKPISNLLTSLQCSAWSGPRSVN